VLVVPLQVTVLPDCRHAAAAGVADITLAITIDKTNSAARVSHRPALPFDVDPKVIVHALLIGFISSSRIWYEASSAK
jgi:hypothetical protein